MDLSAQIFAYLESVGVRSLVLFAVAAGVLAAFRVKAAAARHAVWTVVAGGMLLLAALAPALPPLPLRLLKPAPATVAQLPDLPAPDLSAAAEPAPPAPAPPRFTWQEGVAIAYAAVALILLARLTFSYLFTQRLLRAATPTARFNDAYTSTWISVPMTVGRKILLPAGWEQWEEAKLQAVLAHERTHVRRADWVIALLAGVNRCVFWFHPLAWWLERHLATLAEQACDDSALLLVPSEHYAQALLEMAAAVNTAQGRLLWEAMAMAKTAEIRRRIDRILDETRQIPRAVTRTRWLALLACSLPLIWVAAVAQLVPAIAQEAPKTPAAMAEFLKGRRQLSPSDVNMMEQYLAAHPQDIDVRSQLILYYYSAGIREPRLTHILWLIQNHPEATVTAFASSGVTPRDSAMNSRAEYDRVLGAWKNAVAARQNDLQVLQNAAQFLQTAGDLREAEALLKGALNVMPSSPSIKDRLGKLYALAILQGTGDPKFPASDPQFSMRVRSELPNSEDGILLFSAGNALATVARQPLPGQPLPAGVLNLDEHPLLQPAIALGQQLMERAGQFGGPRIVTQVVPGRGVLGGIISSTPRGGVPGGVRGGVVYGSSAPVQMGSTGDAPQVNLQPAPPVARSVEPEYPPLARQARISGIVKLRVTIGTDGTVRHIEVMSGHPLLIPSALEAVKQTTFQPPAVETTSQIDVPFTLPPGDAPQQAMQQYAVRMGSAANAPQQQVNLQPAPPVARRVEPEYPPLARQARISGVVKLRVTVGTDGTVRHIEVMSGHPLLVPAALEAMKQTTFQPPAVETTSQIDVPFTLPPGDAPQQTMQPYARIGRPDTPAMIRVGGNVQAAKLVSKIDPIYPPAARAENIEGDVTLNITIAEDGQVESAEPVSGNPVLAAAALDAVKQWRYQPTLFNGNPVKVGTTVTVPFQLH